MNFICFNLAISIKGVFNSSIVQRNNLRVKKYQLSELKLHLYFS